jgi:hypothetical protein
MKRPKDRSAKTRRMVAGLCLIPLLVIAGCEPLSAEVLQEFVVDFVRSAAAAWLL